jgi:hypothetical protein
VAIRMASRTAIMSLKIEYMRLGDLIGRMEGKANGI